MGGAGIGALAQLGEHLLCKQGVIGSIPIGSTILRSICRAFGASIGWPLSPEMKNEIPVTIRRAPVPAGFARIFDIVNGFLIDAVTRGIRLSSAG